MRGACGRRAFDPYPVLLAKDPTAANERRVNDTLKRLKSKGKQDEKTVNNLRVPQNGTRPPMFYGCVKMHKQGAPLRPIVSAVGSATYKLAKFVNKLLSPYLVEVESYVKNTSDFVEQLESLSVASDELLVSFDVKPLFTSVPVPAALDAVREIVEEDADFATKNGIESGTAMELLRVCLTTTSFQFQARHYELADGLAMGSPISPVVANLFMPAKLEKRALASFAYPPRSWLRFVDDVFSIVRACAVKDLLNHLNSQDPAIEFTTEEEHDGKLPFLDSTVTRRGNALKTDVYRKPTHTGRYLSFNSHHPPSAKRSVVNALMKRKEYVTTGEDAVRAEDEKIRNELAMNGYPTDFVNGAINSRKHAAPAEVIRSNGTAVIPYCRGVSEAVRRVLASHKIRTVMRPRKLKWSLMRDAKDSIPPKNEPGVVYAVGCKTCPNVYIGETARTAATRIREHQYHTRSQHPELSGIAAHVINEGHTVHWEPRVVARETNLQKRKLKEALFIDKVRNRNMNMDRGLEISPLWLDLLREKK